MIRQVGLDTLAGLFPNATLYAALSFILAAPGCFAAGSTLTVSSASTAPDGSAVLNLTFAPGYAGSDAGLQWNLNVPVLDVASVATSVGDAAVAAGKSLSCSGTTCLLSGMNATPIGSGVVAIISLTMSTQARGNLAIQLINAIEALTDGSAGSVTTTDGVVSVLTPITVSTTPPTASLSSSQTQQFAATVSGTSNTTVNWSISPQVGTLSVSGLYTAPASITSTQVVTVTAVSADDYTKSASATVTLVPAVAVVLTPTSSSLTASQSQQFTATVTGTANTVVTWSLSPQVGTISSGGLYTAPVSITTAQTVAVTAISAADPSKSDSVTVSLTVPIAVAISPTTATLLDGQTQQFTALLATSSTASSTSSVSVTWSISPTVGSISASGAYTAPASGTQLTTVTVTATSVQDPTQSASASVTIVPLAVTITPVRVALANSQTQLFTAKVSGASNTAVTWTMNPEIGTLSAGGLYTAPSSIPNTQTVTVTARSVADPTKSATATVKLSPKTKKSG